MNTLHELTGPAVDQGEVNVSKKVYTVQGRVTSIRQRNQPKRTTGDQENVGLFNSGAVPGLEALFTIFWLNRLGRGRGGRVGGRGKGVCGSQIRNTTRLAAANAGSRRKQWYTHQTRRRFAQARNEQQLRARARLQISREVLGCFMAWPACGPNYVGS